jgi:hypothetical protein
MFFPHQKFPGGISLKIKRHRHGDPRLANQDRGMFAVPTSGEGEGKAGGGGRTEQE